MKDNTTINFKLTYEEYLYIVTILERELKENQQYVQSKQERGEQDDILYPLTQNRKNGKHCERTFINRKKEG